MAKAFSIRDYMDDAIQHVSETDVYDKVSVFDIQPNEDDFYELSNIEQLKNSIYAMGGVQQNVLLVRLAAGSKYKYKVLAGHRRTHACVELVQEGHSEFEYIPAVIKENIDRDAEEMLLVMTNSTQRELTDWEKVMQHMKLKVIIPKLKKRQGLDGKTRALEADYLGVSEGQIAIYNTIGTKLDAWLMGLLKDGTIGISLAYEAAKLDAEEQQQLVRMSVDSGGISEEDIKRLVGDRNIKGQMKIAWSEAEIKKVTDSDTNKCLKNKSVQAPAAEKKEICYTNNKDDVDGVIYFVFRLGDFPEDTLHELIKVFGHAQNFSLASTAAQNIFDSMLPYEDKLVRVVYQMGYQVEYIETHEFYKIPIYDFWQGFVREFKNGCKTEPTENKEEVHRKKVTESDTHENEQEKLAQIPAAVNEIKTGIVYRGGYELAMIDIQVKKYEGYLDLLEDCGELPYLRSEYNCLLDALELLRADFVRREI